MNNEELLNKVAAWVGETADKIGDFAAREIPPFIHEYLAWKFWENIIGIIFHFIFLFVVIGVITLSYKTIKFFIKKTNGNYASDGWFMGTIFSFVIGAACSIILSVNWIKDFPSDKILECVQIKMAPKIYLVEKAAEIYQQVKK